MSARWASESVSSQGPAPVPSAHASSRARPVWIGVVLLANALLFWLLMMAVHELGHVLHAAATGGRVTHVELHPLAISRTDVQPNPKPLTVAWGGTLWGAVIPLAGWGIASVLPRIGRRWLKAFAGFCLIANGLYLVSAIAMPVGDTQDLRTLGVPVWAMVLAGTPMLAAGVWLWHSLGRCFGLANATNAQARRWAGWSFCAFALTCAAMWWWSSVP